MMKLRGILLLGAVALVTAGCQNDSRQQVLAASTSSVQLRSFQSRAFDTTDKEKTLRTVIATLQDLSFVVDKADATLGTVSATKLNRYMLRMTVTVRPRGETQMLVRANANYQEGGSLPIAIEDPEPYQNFYAALEKAMFLTAQEVE